MTKYDQIINLIQDISTRVTDMSREVTERNNILRKEIREDMQVLKSDIKEDLTEFKTTFTKYTDNHALLHDKEKQRKLSITKWIIATTLSTGGIFTFLYTIGVI